MEQSISLRCSKLFQILTGKVKNKRDSYKLLDWEPLIDAFLLFVDTECSYEAQKRDKQISLFFKKYKGLIDELKDLRIKKTDFDIIKTIGRGHFGEVYVVKEKVTGDVYAMKALKKASTLSQDETSFYEEERDVMAFANCLWVTALQYSFQDSENLYFVMEFHPGGDLVNLISKYENGIMDEDSARFYLAEIVLAIHSVHEIGYVHRDVKPENILLDMTGHVKLADFGSAARLVAGKQNVCRIPVGTPEYVAPEILTCMNTGGGLYGVECDWWSLGVMAFEMMCGALPFEADGVLQLYSKIMNFKDSLEFYEDVELNKHSKNLICALLTDSKSRIRYEKLAIHEFFDKIDWTTLQDIPPPYIPQLKGPLDTSHFDDFKGSQKTIPAGVASKNSIANDLPFVGFTFTRPLHQSFLSESQRVNSAAASSPILDRLSSELKADEVSNLRSFGNSLNDDLKKKSDQTETALKELQVKYKEVKNTLNEKTELIRETEKRLALETDQYNNVNSQLQQYQNYADLYKEAKKRIENKSLELTQLEKQVQELEIEKKELLSKISAFEYEIESIKKKSHDSEEYWKEYEVMQTKAQNDLKTLVEELKSRIEKNVKDNKIKDNELTVKLTEFINASGKLRSVASGNDSEKYSPIITNEEIEKKDAPELKKILFYTLDNIKLLRMENDEKADLYDETCLKNEKLRMRMIDLEEILAQNKTKMDQCEIEILNLNQSSSSLKDNFEHTIIKLNDCQTTLALYEVEMKELRSSKSELEREASSLKMYLDTEKNNLEKFKIKAFQKKEKYRNKNKHLHSLLTEKENKLLELVSFNTKIEEERNAIKSELDSVKEELVSNNEKVLQSNLAEINRLSSLVSTQKASNFSLSQELSSFKKRAQDLVEENEEMVATYERQENAHREQIIKFESTIAQQNKLIDFLHTGNAKKKSNKGKNDGKLGSPQSDFSSPTPHQRRARDLELQLELEREQCLKLNSELTRSRDENKSLKMEVSRISNKNINAIADYCSTGSRSPASDFCDSPIRRCFTVESKEKGEVNHQMIGDVNIMASICCVCQIPLPFGRQVSRCTVCKISVHSSCESSLSLRCSAFENLSIVETDPTRLYYDCKAFDLSSKSSNIGSWLSVPYKASNSKYDWQKNWIHFDSNTITISSDDSSDSEVLCVIKLLDENYSLTVHSAVHSCDIISFTPSSFVPFVFGIEVEVQNFSTSSFFVNVTKNSSEDICRTKTLFLMAPSLEEKRLWVLELQKLMRSSCKNVICSSPTFISKFDQKNARNFRNISPLNADAVLISSADGVFFFSLSERQLLMCSIASINCWFIHVASPAIFGIVGAHRALVQFHSDKIKSLAKFNKPFPLHSTDVPNIDNVHIVTSFYKDSNHFVLVARSMEIVCLKLDGSSIQKNWSLSCHVPTSFLLYNNGKVIYEGEKIFVYDIVKQQKNSFLSVDDHSLAYIIYGSSNENNFPVNVFPLFEGKKDTEFLVCFSEFGVVVDENGKRSRSEDIRWKFIPISFNFSNQILYVCYQFMIEMYDFMSHPKASDSSEIVSKYIWSSKVLGNIFNGDGLYLSSIDSEMKTTLWVCYPHHYADALRLHSSKSSDHDASSSHSSSSGVPNKVLSKLFSRNRSKTEATKFYPNDF